MLTKENVKLEITKARLNKDSFRTELLKLVLGEFERLEYAGQKPLFENVITKLIQSNKECLAQRQDSKLQQEVDVLESYLPKYVTQEELRNLLSPLGLDSSGKSIGQAIKWLKENHVAFKNEDVKPVLEKICA